MINFDYFSFSIDIKKYIENFCNIKITLNKKDMAKILTF